MKKRVLGHSGIEVSPISVGCWSFGGGAYWGEQSQKDVDEVVNTALDNGVNLFDCAEAYNDGDSEISLGKAVKARRDEAIIVTKQYITPDKDDTIQRFEAALKRLDSDYVDVMMIHWPSENPSDCERVFKRYNQLKEQGKVRALGVSNFGVEQMAMMTQMGFHPCVNELHYNIASRAIEDAIIPACQKLDMGIISYVSLQQGVLTGKYDSFTDIPPRRARYRHFSVERAQGLNDHKTPGAEAELLELLGVLRDVCKEKNTTMSELVLSWALRQEGITSAIVGSRNLAQFHDSLKGALYTLDDATNDYLTQASQALYKKLGTVADYQFPLDQSRIH